MSWLLQITGNVTGHFILDHVKTCNCALHIISIVLQRKATKCTLAWKKWNFQTKIVRLAFVNTVLASLCLFQLSLSCFVAKCIHHQVLAFQINGELVKDAGDNTDWESEDEVEVLFTVMDILPCSMSRISREI